MFNFAAKKRKVDDTKKSTSSPAKAASCEL